MEVANKIVMKKISEIKPYVRNPRKNDKTVALLVDIIPKVGFNVPLVIDKDGIIVKGHARFRAAIKLGMTELPCVITDADEEAIKLDRIADNRISEFSEWLSEPLMHELDMLSLDFSNLDFDMPSVADIPDFEQFESDLGNDDEPADTETEEERKARYEAFMAQQVKPVEIVKQAEIDRAEAKAQQIPKKPINYIKVVCEKCGHIMFVSEADLWNPETGLVK